MLLLTSRDDNNSWDMKNNADILDSFSRRNQPKTGLFNQRESQTYDLLNGYHSENLHPSNVEK